MKVKVYTCHMHMYMGDALYTYPNLRQLFTIIDGVYSKCACSVYVSLVQ